MSLPLPSWKDRLSIAVDGKLIPVRDSTFTSRSAKERLHTTQKPNTGFIHLPHEFTVSFSTYAVDDVGPFLLERQEQDLENIELVLGRAEGDNFTFVTLTYGRGTISNVTLAGVDARSIPVLSVDVEFLDAVWA